MVQLTIIFDPANPNNVAVRGPIHDKMLCYAMLERAKDAIREHDPSNPRIQQPTEEQKGVLLKEHH